ncbi:MAG: cation:proton antiporter [Alphaproteobacteria bacterium]|nr:cation:proton antiporter [Alphaproteobacteria bacterium]
MHDSIGLTQIAIVVAAALAGGLTLARLKQPPILGYILTGVLLGPSAFELISNRGSVEILAELGVLLLLFVVGMELNLRSFKKVWKTATFCTLAQIIISSSIAVLLSLYYGWTPALSMLIGFIATLSSTAVVVKMMESMGEMKTDTGQLIIGILIAQDLAIAPMILIIRNFNHSWFSIDIFLKLLVSIGLIIGIITYLSRRQRVRIPLAKIVAGEKELTALASLAFCFIAAAIAGQTGLSAPYGAFLAGLILGNTHERLVLIETTKPIQSILIMCFFLSIGLLLDVKFMWTHINIVLGLLLIVTVGKTLLNVIILHCLKLPWSQAFMVSAIIAQLGEFAFLLSTVAYEANVINSFGENLIISLTVLSLAISPLWFIFARYLKNVADTTNTLSIRLYFKSLISRKKMQGNSSDSEPFVSPTHTSDNALFSTLKQRKKGLIRQSELDEDKA